MNCDIVELSNNITNFCDVDVMGIIVRSPCAVDCLKSISYGLMYCTDFFIQHDMIYKLTSIYDFCNSD